ncbi:hypothetical protein [Pseudomonas lactis]|uniref:hypothetical protein n=1 Tax=Pseudomonas lactis TaxID=1615674 RepID=UPI000317A721
MLAKIANDNADNQAIRGALQVFASKLAPTQKPSNKKPEKPGNKKPDIIIGLEVARQAGKSVGCR